MFDHKYGVSQRQAARKFKSEASYVNKILRNKSSIKFFKKQNIPKRDEEKRLRIQTCCVRLFKNYRDFEWIIEDESYFTIHHRSINGN